MSVPGAAVLGAPPPDVAGPGPGAAPLPAPPVPAVAPAPPVVGMPQMPGVPVGPAGPHWDPSGTVPVAGSPADPAHPAQQPGPPPAPVAAPVPTAPPATAEDAAARRYTADQKVADVDQKTADNAAETAKTDETQAAKKAEDLKQQAAETAAEDARQQAGLAKATAERDQLRQDTKDFKFHNFYDSRTTSQTILAGLGVILAGASRDPNHVNQAARDIDTAISREWDAQKADLDRKFQLARLKTDDVKELASQYAMDSGKLKLRQEQQLNALAAETDFLASKSKNQAGILAAQKVAAEARALAEQHGQQGVKDIAEAHSSALKDAETQAQTALALAKTAKAKRAGGGGGGSSAAGVQLEEDIKNHPEWGRTEISRRGIALGLKLNGKPSETTVASVIAGVGKDAAATGKTDAAAAKQATANDKDTVRVGGTPLGLVPSGRGGAVAYGKLLEGYKDSIESVKDLLTYVEQNPKKAAVLGTHLDAFHRAVLALQATSTANATDTTTKHEAESMKSMGILRADAIRTTLRHLEERNKAYTADLRPLPGTAGAGGFKNGPATDVPPGAVKGKLNGKPGYVLNGQFTAF